MAEVRVCDDCTRGEGWGMKSYTGQGEGGSVGGLAPSEKFKRFPSPNRGGEWTGLSLCRIN